MDVISFWQYADIQVVDINNCKLSSHTKIPASLLSTSSFIFIRRGSAQLLLDEQIFSVHGVQLFHVGPNSWIEWHTGKEPVEYIILSYEAHIRSDLASKIDCPFNLVSRIFPSNPAILHDILEKMLELIQDKKSIARFQMKALFYQWIAQVLEQNQSSSEHLNAANPVALVTMAMEYMLEHYAEPITLDSLAVAMNCSPGHLSNRFKQILNRGPIDCLIHLRMKRASTLLIETQMSLRSIAAATSYQDVYYFSKAFKKHTGIAPSVFRKRGYMSEDITSNHKIYDIVDSQLRCYIENDNRYQFGGKKGESTTMFKKHLAIPASLLIAFGLLLGACSSAGNTIATNGNVEGSKESTTKQPVNTEGKSAGTRVISTANGDIEIPANPERIVTDYYVGHLLALGVKPIGSLGLYMQSPYLEGETDGIEDIGDSLETIVALKPDLIITGNSKNVESYAKIAPTVLITLDSNVRGEVRQIGHILGKEEVAATWEKEFDEQIADARSEAQELITEGETVTVFAGGIQKTITIYGNGYTGKSIYNELQLSMQENIAKEINPEQPWMEISNEVLRNYAGDYIFVAVDLKSESYDYASDSIWGTLPAVQENKVFEIDGYRFWFSDPISLQGQVSDIVDMLSEREVEKR
ncbi:AraC family transcriptional regulator [Metasolibacillus meyeri]|uniref:AraC family transcriptional regulator n=1 Tax=Metasolibacillus meyeri TaxID=1071052 RepID=A0AAW9NM08_9BACL|nr:AraC family transcriptional regulator [Metasolibacillus meyeri]MEC1178417.1 AraC family transcriptional regulator [Metasolibacillus meyeri]